MNPPKYRELPEDEGRSYHIETQKINWTVIIVQGLVQMIALGGLLVGYALTNERWKGGIDVSLNNLRAINVQQSILNERLRIAIEKISDNMTMLSNNQQKVITLLEMHMSQDKYRLTPPRKESDR